ncbi:DUF2442 domain-containing protein [Helicobacter sp.]|uniref:DUF2442 domain-containing protein n=2 Tax=Helicobacter sp. TaxID=218 RepID=UPI002A9098E0|nr:DUF2442 domain-containing protein [Helicobacter sp.]MDY5556507.1 DUF2442 domain-containing protein [Helicobacter sp.]
MNFSVKGKKVRFVDNLLIVELQDGRIIGTPISWYKELENASIATLNHYHFICDDTGIEWDELDYHLSILSMLEHSEKIA